MKVAVLVDQFTPGALTILNDAGYTVETVVLAQKEASSYTTDADAVIVRIGIAIDRSFIARQPKLRAIATATTGLNHIDLAAAAERNIEIISLRDDVAFLDTITSTAELSFGLLIDLMRRTPWAYDAVRAGEYPLEAFRGQSLSGETIGIIGLGRLGKIVAAGAAGWRMKVVYTDPNVSAESFPQYTKTDLHTLLAQSDAISIHVHLSPETEGMIGSEAIDRMKTGAYLVNTARGELVDEAAVIRALKSGKLAGYATDVPSSEARIISNGSVGHPLIEYAKTGGNCIVVPHTGGLTFESRERTDMHIAKKLIDRLA